MCVHRFRSIDLLIYWSTNLLICWAVPHTHTHRWGILRCTSWSDVSMIPTLEVRSSRRPRHMLNPDSAAPTASEKHSTGFKRHVFSLKKKTCSRIKHLELWRGKKQTSAPLQKKKRGKLWINSPVLLEFAQLLHLGMFLSLTQPQSDWRPGNPPPLPRQRDATSSSGVSDRCQISLLINRLKCCFYGVVSCYVMLCHVVMLCANTYYTH